MLLVEIFVQVQTFWRMPFVPSHNFCHPDIPLEAPFLFLERILKSSWATYIFTVFFFISQGCPPTTKCHVFVYKNKHKHKCIKCPTLANGTSANMASEAQESKGIANTQIHAYKPQSWPIFQRPLWLVRCRHLKVVEFCCKIKFLLSGVTTHPPPASHRSTKIDRSQDHFPFYKKIFTQLETQAHRLK